jgi:hypothetical protein
MNNFIFRKNLNFPGQMKSIHNSSQVILPSMANILSMVSILFMVMTVSCDDQHQETRISDFNDFCSVAPEGWTCNITTSDFDSEKIPQDAETPIAIIEYWNPNITFTSYLETKVNPSLIIDIYEISRKQELLDFIGSQQLYSWCIPMYYGETREYFILTSPCFINGGSFTDEANSSIDDLHEALKEIITVKEYTF